MEEEKRKRGRPKKELDEILKGNSLDDDDDELRAILNKNKNKIPSNNFEDVDIDGEALNEIEEFETQEGVNDIPNEEFNPLDEPVMQRSYTGGMSNTGSTINPYTLQEKIIEEPKYNTTSTTSKIEVDSDLINPSPSNSGGGLGGNSNTNVGDIPNDFSQANNQNNSQNNTQNKPVENDNLKELSLKEKREGVEKTADVMLLAWKNYIPLPFEYFSKFDNKKLKKLHDADELNLDAQIKNDGTTFREYAKEFNSAVEKTFQVSDDEITALKDPLVDVLMEKDIAFTPTQRLLFTAGQLIASKVMVAAKFLSEKKSDIEEMKSMHKKNTELKEKELELNQEKLQFEREKEIQRQKEFELRKKQEVKSNNEEEEDDDNDVIIEEIKNQPSIDDVISDNYDANDDIP